MNLNLAQVSHLFTSPHIGKQALVEDDICPLSRHGFLEEARACIEQEHPRPYVMVYVIDEKKQASLYNAERYIRYVDAIRKYVRCEDSKQTVVKIHFLVVQRLEDGVTLHTSYDPVGYDKQAYPRLFTLACLREQTEEIRQARMQVIPKLAKKDEIIALQLLQAHVHDYPEDSFAYQHLSLLEKDRQQASLYRNQYVELRKKEIKSIPCNIVKSKNTWIYAATVGCSLLIYKIPPMTLLWGPFIGLHTPWSLYHLGKAVHRLYQLCVNKRMTPPVREYPLSFRLVREEEVHANVAVAIPMLDKNLEDEDVDFFIRASHAIGSFSSLTQRLPTEFTIASASIGAASIVPWLITACNRLHQYIAEQ
jgi:hypothetical protein